jgi:transketolase N-terminal domain/subunit
MLTTQAPADKPMNIAIACYGDGAANQGQIWEAANMAKLWGLPLALGTNNFHMHALLYTLQCILFFYCFSLVGCLICLLDVLH